MDHFIADFEKILKTLDLSEREKSLFFRLFQDYLDADKKRPKWNDLSPIPINEIPSVRDLPTSPNESCAKELLDSLVICKLNGGLGTSMGCAGPKSSIEVWEGKSFLDLIVAQIEHLNTSHGCSIPLVLMNSFYTHEETGKIIRKYNSIETHVFNQNTFHRIHRNTNLPLSRDEFGLHAKYPPGHGDFYFCEDLLKILKTFVEQGKKYLFVSNSDNLAATVNLEILNWLASQKISMLMEVTKKTKSDVKGGSLVRYGNRLHLLELAQVPKQNVKEFQNFRRFSNFNTNNLWFSIKDLIGFMESGNRLQVFPNRKTIQETPVIQLEMAIGSGIGQFENAELIEVSRKRFLPVKKTDDLFLLRSDLFTVCNGEVLFRKRPGQALPFIHLGECYQAYDDYCEKIKNIPEISELDQLTIVGNVHFGSGVTLKGNVIFICENGTLEIPDQSIFNNQIVSGKLNIEDF